MNLNTSKSRYPICFSGAWYTVNQPNVLGRSFISPLQRILKKMLVAPEKCFFKKPHPSAKVLTREEVLTGTKHSMEWFYGWIHPIGAWVRDVRNGGSHEGDIWKKKKKKRMTSARNACKSLYTPCGFSNRVAVVRGIEPLVLIWLKEQL